MTESCPREWTCQLCILKKRKGADIHIEGILLGAVSFLSIGIFHPVVIWAEYHFTCKIWPVFLVAGLACLGISTQIEQVIISAIVGVVGFSCLWSIVELRQQKERVRKGWFPKNPKHEQNQD